MFEQDSDPKHTIQILGLWGETIHTQGGHAQSMQKDQRLGFITRTFLLQGN